MKFTNSVFYKLDAHTLQLSSKTHNKVKNQLDDNLLYPLKNSMFWPLRNQLVFNITQPIKHEIHQAITIQI